MPPETDPLWLLSMLFGNGLTSAQAKAGNQAVNTNYLQDIEQLYGLPQGALSAAFSGAVDASAFEDEVVSAPPPPPIPPMEPQVPAMLELYMNDVGPEGQVASLVLERGMAPQAAARQVIGDLDLDPEAESDLVKIANDLVKERSAFEGQQRDFQRQLMEYEQQLSQIPRDAQGNPVGETRPSAAAEPYREAGLPLPTDQWDAGMFSGQGRRQRVADTDVESLQRATDSQRRLMEALRAAPQNPEPVGVFNPNPPAQPPQTAPVTVSTVNGMPRAQVSASALNIPQSTGNLVFDAASNSPQRANAFADTLRRMREEAAPQMRANARRAARTERGFANDQEESFNRAASRLANAQEANSYDDRYSGTRAMLQNRNGPSPLQLAILRRLGQA